MIRNCGKSLRCHDLCMVRTARGISIVHDRTTDLWATADYDGSRGQWTAPAVGGGAWVGPLDYVAQWGSRSAAYRRFGDWTRQEALADYME